MTAPERERSLDDELPQWLAAYDEKIAAGVTELSPAELGAPAELWERLEREAHWCRMVRRIWPLALGASADPSTCVAHSNEPASGELPDRLGRFLVRRELGRGGFGIVSLAYDPHLRREVALKIPRPEIVLTPGLRARFRQEALAAAGLDHSNIVVVYEAGEQGSVCYIASAYCPGPTLSDWLRVRSAPVPPRIAAALVATLAEAIEHAHQRGVVHRDLKPSNVLLELLEPGVSSTDGLDLIPRITDFGLAKVLDSSSSEEPANATLSGVILGTPDYMAPEQADGRARTIGPAADIYSLGAILYTVLTGRPPLQGFSAVETLVLVRTRDPEPPSRLRPRLSRDLETICLKCLEKAPQARYASAGALADDLRRYLAALPIQARPAGAWERAIKWVRRHPVRAVAAGATAATAIVVAVTIGMATVRLQRERDRAEARRLEAVANLNKARDAVDRMLTRVSEKRLANIPQVEPVQRALLEDALEFYRDFALQAPDDPVIQLEASLAYRRLGQTYNGLRRSDEAERLVGEALAIQRRLMGTFPSHFAYAKEVAESMISLGGVRHAQLRFEDAVNCATEALGLLEAIAPSDPHGSGYRRERASAYVTRAMALDRMNRLQAAEADDRKSIALLDELEQLFPGAAEYPMKTAIARNNLGVTMENQGRLEEAELLFRHTLEYWEKIASTDPSNPNVRSKQALALDNVAGICEKRGNIVEAERALRKSAALREGLTKDYPNTPHYLTQLGDELARLADLAAARGDLAEATRLHEQVVARRKALLALAPADADAVVRVRQAYFALAESLIRQKTHDAAAKAVKELVVAIAAGDSGPDFVRAASLQSRCATLATADAQLSETRRVEQARAYADLAVELLREAIKRGPVDTEAVKADPGFDAIRGRVDFRELVSRATNSSTNGAR